MKKLAPYWFLETPIDEEHKRYVLLAYLKGLEKDLKGENKINKLRELNSILRNVKCYEDTGDFFPRTLSEMTESQVGKLRKLETIVLKEEKDEEVKKILDSTKKTIESFLEEHSENIKEIDDLFRVTVNRERKKFFWDRGYLVIKNHTLDQIRVYLWRFSPITIKGEEQIALLMSICYPEDTPKEVGFGLNATEEEIEFKLKQDFGSIYNRDSDPVVIVDLLMKGTNFLETEFGKEKASEYIVKTYKNFLKNF
jgi:hypothetical protein